MIRKIQLNLLAILVLVSSAIAAETNCPEHFAGGIAPDLLNPKLTVMAREVCYSGYAVMHSGVTRTPIYAAEYLTRERLLKAKGVKRQNSFHPDDNIPESERAELKHYAKSGYDRGHMAPSADMFDEKSQYESFSLANIVPQVKANNRGAWAKIEAEVRSLVMERGNLYVVTGPIFDDKNRSRIGDAVDVPAKLFKAVIDFQRLEAWVYLIENSAVGNNTRVSINDLEGISRIRVFPK